MTLTVSEIERWSAGDVREVFHAATSRAQAAQDGKFVGTRFLDPGQAHATAEPLFTAVTAPLGIGPAVKGGEAAYLGLRSLFAKESVEALAGSSADDILSQGAELAATRAQAATEHLASGQADNIAVPHSMPDHAMPDIAHDLPLSIGAAGSDDVAGSVRTVNPGSGDYNCVNCVITTDLMLDGQKASAVLGGPKPITFLESYFNASFVPVTDSTAIEGAMIAAGDGARGVVFASRGPGIGHVFNVVNQNGVVRFLDGQTGTVAKFDGYQSFEFMRYR